MKKFEEDFFIILNSVLKAVGPEWIFKHKLRINKSSIEIGSYTINLDSCHKIYVIGFGKASSAMATELEKYLFNRIEDGVIITKYGFKTPTKRIRVYEAGHPIPDEKSIKYSQEIINLCKTLTEEDLVICLISGGGSALFEVLNPEIDLNSLTLLNEFLLKQQISIYEINRIRKALSQVKGGKLLNFIHPASCLSLIISDVVGNDLSVIASGATFIGANQSYSEIKNAENLNSILNENNPFARIYDLIVEKNFDKKILNYFNEKVHNFIIASNEDAVDTAVNESKKLGYEIYKIEYNLLAPTEEVCMKIINEINSMNYQSKNYRKSIIFGGETFLNVTGKGLGGRNSHLILQIANEIISRKLEFNFNFLIASIATDGNDGPTDAAGAFITNRILEKIKSSNINPSDYLNNFDSYNFFKEFGCLIKTGATNTNVADLIICLLEK